MKPTNMVILPSNFWQVPIIELSKLYSPPPEPKKELKVKKVIDCKGKESKFFTWDEKDYQY